TWTPEAAMPALPTPQQQASETLPAGKPRFFDLARDARRSMFLEVVEGGLFGIETLARLKTSLLLSSLFLTGLVSASYNGSGQIGAREGLAAEPTREDVAPGAAPLARPLPPRGNTRRCRYARCGAPHARRNARHAGRTWAACADLRSDPEIPMAGAGGEGCAA